MVLLCLHCVPNQRMFSLYRYLWCTTSINDLCSYPPNVTYSFVFESGCMHACMFVCLLALCVRMHFCVPWRPGSAKSSCHILQALFRSLRLCFGVLAHAFLSDQLCSQRRSVTLQPNLTSRSILYAIKLVFGNCQLLQRDDLKI